MNFKNNDVFFWKYNKQKLKKKNDGNNGGTTYWCNSRYAIWNEGNQKLTDTYWNGSSDRSFSKECITNDLELEFLGNLDDFDVCNKHDFAYYKNEDVLNISHANMSRGGFYLRKGAEKSHDKMKKVFALHIEYHKKEIESNKSQVKFLEERLANFDPDGYLPQNDNVWLGDL